MSPSPLATAGDRRCPRPCDGVYAGHLADEADGAPRPPAISVGTNPPVGRRVEAHVLDFEGDRCGHRVSVSFRHRLRGQATFAGTNELVAQMQADIDQARRLLSSPRWYSPVRRVPTPDPLTGSPRDPAPRGRKGWLSSGSPGAGRPPSPGGVAWGRGARPLRREWSKP
jgi:hypothetical protein